MCSIAQYQSVPPIERENEMSEEENEVDVELSKDEQYIVDYCKDMIRTHALPTKSPGIIGKLDALVANYKKAKRAEQDLERLTNG